MNVINADGGIGRCIALTGAIELMEEKPIIVTGFPEVFLNNPNVERVYPFNQKYLYEDVIYDNNYINPEPYEMKEYYHDKKHVSECFNILLNNIIRPAKPKIYLTSNEKANAKKFIESHDKPVVLLQCFSSTGGVEDEDQTLRSLKFEFAEKLYNKLSEKYVVYHIRDNKQMNFKDAKTFNNTQRQIMALIPFVKGVVCIDSFLQHACAALDKPAFVFWAGTREENFGYDIHKNWRIGEIKNWKPLRMPVDNSVFYDENKSLIDFSDKDIEACVEWIDNQK